MKKFFTLCILLGMAVVFVNANNDELYYNFANEQVSLEDLDIFDYADFPEGTTFKLFRDEVDALGIRHQSYQQYYNNVRVENKMILVHSRDGLLSCLNGNIFTLSNNDINQVGSILLSKMSAIRKINNNAQDDKGCELLLVRVRIDNKYIYRMAYKVTDWLNMEMVYIDAETGEIVKRESLVQSVDVKGSATTMYSGKQEMTSYLKDGVYYLMDEGRNIITANASNALCIDYENANPNDADATCKLMTDYISSCSLVSNTSPNWVADYHKYIKSITLNAVSFSELGDTKPDAYIKILDKQGNVVYTSGYYEDPNFPVAFNLEQANIEITSLPFVIELWDYDPIGNDDYIGYSIIDMIHTGIVELTQLPTLYSEVPFESTKFIGSVKFMNKGLQPMLDMHWGMQKTIDFYRDIFNRNSFDDKGGELYQLYNPATDIGLFATMPLNAAAVTFGEDLRLNIMMYGTGAHFGESLSLHKKSMKPLVALDVMAHEFSHLVTNHNKNGKLVYLDESGALNESFSDIMAMGVEKYVYGYPDWTIGEDFMVYVSDMRSMKNPHLSGAGAQPKYRGGENWKALGDSSINGDSGGVHTNSGVPNYWFYIVSNGLNGVNEKGDNVNVSKIGIDKALQIVYRTHQYYLTPEADFDDARLGTIISAQDLYGTNSTEEIAVTNAWHAVGVGDKYVEEPTTSSDQFLVLAQRKTGGNWFYMTADLGTAGTKRFQAIDAGTSVKEDINRTPDGEKYLWSFEDVAGGVALKNGTQYATWNAGNSAILSSTPKAFSIVDAGEDIVNISFVDGDGNTRYLSLNATEGNNYFAFYKGTTQKYNLLIIPYGGQQPPIEEAKEEFVVLAQRNNTSNWFYMTADLGTAGTKRFQAVDAGTPNKSMINTSPTDSKYIWSFEEVAGGIALVNEKQYASWKSGNSAILSTTPMALNITDISDDQVNMSFVDNEGNTRYLSLNATVGNNYFAFYKGTTQKCNLLVIPYGEKITTELETITLTETPIVQKIMRDGQLLILRDGKTYNVMGQEI